MKTLIFHVGMLETNCYLVYDEDTKKGIIIDPGDDAKRLLAVLCEKGIELSYIILTHGHFDHALAVPELLQSTNAKLIAGKDERLDDAVYCGYRAFGNIPFRALCADIKISDGDEIEFYGETLSFYATPGHTTGGISIRIGDALFVGDTLFAGSCGRCDLPGGSYDTILDSLKKLASLPGNLRVYPGHGGATTLENELKNNPYMREAMR